MDIAGQCVLVTGGASGIGRASAMAFARKSAAKVVICDVDEAGMAATAEEVRAAGAQVRCDRVDLADMDALQAWLAACEADRYAVLFNNAGVVSGSPMFPEASVPRLRWILDVNLTAVVVATQVGAQAMGARGGGIIVNTVSTVALGRGFYDVMYATSKAGVMMFTRACAGLKESLNVRVAGVLPGLTETPIFARTGENGYAPWMERIIATYPACQPSDIAGAVIDLVEDDALEGGDWVAVSHIDGAIVRRWGHDEPTP